MTRAGSAVERFVIQGPSSTRDHASRRHRSRAGPLTSRTLGMMGSVFRALDATALADGSAEGRGLGDMWRVRSHQALDGAAHRQHVPHAGGAVGKSPIPLSELAQAVGEAELALFDAGAQ